MPNPRDSPDVGPPPAWAVDKASAELYDVSDHAAVLERAWALVDEAQQLEEERHDEYDDPDLGGEG